MSTHTSTIAFFGATGDCAGYCLAAALEGGYHCSALARSPDKLVKSLEAKGINGNIIQKQLRIVEGDVKSVEAVKQALYQDGQLAEQIISGIGGTPTLQWSLPKPVTLTDPTICQDAGATILEALKEIHSDRKPFLFNVSTTGISSAGCPRNVPLLFYPMYHWLLAVPHADKKVLEQNLSAHMNLPESERALRGFVNIRPSMLVDGKGSGVESVREGSDQSPAVGYTISRQDVGKWMFERLVKGNAAKWTNGGVSITC
jgi:hypothetical protein